MLTQGAAFGYRCFAPENNPEVPGGAPKIRAMQIINELETQKRGCYAGAVGYFGFDGALDCCIALRSIVLKDGRAYLQAGAGIVADSDPTSEYQETVNKATAMIEAISRASDE